MLDSTAQLPSISDHARPADAQLRKGFGPRVRKLHARIGKAHHQAEGCLLYTSPSPRDLSTSRMPSSA